MKNKFDVIVIGSGSGGLTTSIGLSAAGKKVALIEKGRIGGDCTNFGCVPSKAFIDIAKNGNHKDITGVLQEVRERRQVIRDEETKAKLEKHGLQLFKGFASFKDKNTVLVGKKTELTAQSIIISTGSHANTIDIPGVHSDDILTNETVFELEENIKHIAVIGGGYIGCELAEAFANAGVKVSIIQRNTSLIPREESEVSGLLSDVFEEKGIEIFTNSGVVSGDGKKLKIKNNKTGKIKTITYDKVLVALGRSPNIDGLNLEAAGIKSEKNGINVNKYNRTSQKNIFAIGDCVAGNPQFTHLANNEGRGVIKNILVPKLLQSSVRRAALPAVLYTNLEVARVGKTREEILKHYGEETIISKTLYFSGNDRSKLTDDEKGCIIVHYKRVSGKVLGATIVGTKAGEMLPVLISAMDNKISAYKLSKLIFPYPTKSEIIKKVADQFVVHTLSNAKNEMKYLLKDNILQIATAIIWISLLSAFFSYKKAYGLGVEQIAIQIYNFISGNMAVGPLIYILLYAIRPIVFFPATIMTFMSGALFGPWLGIVFTLVGENMSAAFSYFLGSVFGKKVLGPDSDGGVVSDLKEKANQAPFMSILMTRLLFFPFDLVNYASGFLRIKFIPFFLATIVGIIPGASVFVIAGGAFHGEGISSFGDLIKNIDISLLYGAALLFVVTLVFAKVLKKYQKKLIK